MALFSIIVPIYNVEKYIYKCLDSLTNQSFSDIEIILVDDESPDNCPLICDHYAEKDNRIKVIHKKNGGLSDARNAGLKVAQGKYVLFVDSDDYISHEACERISLYAEKNYDIIICNAVVEGGECPLQHIETVERKFSGVEYLKEAFSAQKAPMAVWLNVFRRDFLLQNALFFKYGILHEDEQFTPRAFLCAESVVVTDIEFYHYVIRSNSIMTKKDKRKNAMDLLCTACEYEEFLKDYPDKQLKFQLLNSFVGKYLGIYQAGDLKRYGKEFLPIKFLLRNAHSKKNKFKVLLVCISPKLYSFIHSKVKG